MLTDFIRHEQGQLFIIVESDDVYFEGLEEVAWFRLLVDLDWQLLRPVAAKYYDALYRFNVQQARARKSKPTANPETQEEATQRLLFERPTLDEEAEILHQPKDDVDLEIDIQTNPQTLSPGVVPLRWAGRAPKCFFAMFKAFIGVAVSGVAPEPEQVYAKLLDNPAYARTCGFTLPSKDKSYRQSDIPALRKLEQFDQIMSEAGLWSEARIAVVRDNLATGKIKVEATVVHDATHFKAYSQMRVVEVSQQAEPQDDPMAADNAGDTSMASADAAVEVAPTEKPVKKSHPETTKECRCEDRDQCGHPWVSADQGAGTVVKSSGKKYWAHKASTISFADQEVMLDAVAVADAAAHDSRTLPDHMARLLSIYPELDGVVNRVLDDGAADDEGLKDLLLAEWQIELLAPINPRGRKPIRNDLPRGVDHVTPRGVPVCIAGYPMDFAGCRRDTEHFIFRAPDDENGQPVCQGCSLKDQCYRGGDGARQVTIPFDRLPWIDPEFPQLSKRFAKVMTRRTVVERMHKLMKFDYGDDRLTKRGNEAFQARLDKTLLAMHLVIAQG
jgi:hypothetical protein